MTGGIGFFVFFGYWHIFTFRDQTVGDMRAMNIADDLNNGTGVAVAKIITTLGALPVTGSVALAAALSLALRRRVAEAVALVAGMGLTVWAVHWAKGAVDRPRPDNPLVSAIDSVVSIRSRGLRGRLHRRGDRDRCGCPRGGRAAPRWSARRSLSPR